MEIRAPPIAIAGCRWLRERRQWEKASRRWALASGNGNWQGADRLREPEMSVAERL